MKKTLSLMIVLTMVAALAINAFAFNPVSTLADDQLVEVYSDRFDDDHDADDWLCAGGVKVADGVMTLGMPLGSWTSTGYMAMLNSSAVDYSQPHVIEFKATVTHSGSCYAGFALRAGNMGDSPFPNLMNGGRWGTASAAETATGIAVDLHIFNGTVDQVFGISFEDGEAQGTSAQFLANVPEGFHVNEETSYKIADDGDKITCWANDILLFTITMSDLQDGWYQTVTVTGPSGEALANGGGRDPKVSATGRFGFFQRDKGITVDDVVVKVEKKPEFSMLNAAFDVLKYDETALVSEKAYLWVHDEANRPAMDFEKGQVSTISFRGWAYTTMPVAGFGYRIDGGELVTNASFVEDRSSELGAYPGAKGYLVNVPVDELMTGEHTIGIYVLDEYERDILIVKTKNDVDYPIEITFTISASSVLPTDPVNSNHNIDIKKCNADMTEFNVYGWSVYNMPVQALGYVLDGGDPVWVITEVSDEPRTTDNDRAPNDIYVNSGLNTVLAQNGLTGGLDPFYAYRINLTLDITGFVVGEEHTLEVIIKYTDEAETVANAFRTETFTITRKVPNKFTFIVGEETSKVNTGAVSNVEASMNGDVIVFTTTKASDTWFEIPLDKVDSSVYTKIEFKYRAQSVWQNNAYLKATTVNTGYSGTNGTWCSPGLVGDGEWHVKTYVIAESFPALAGTLLTGLRIPAGAAVGDTFEVEYVALRTDEEPTAPAELVPTWISFDVVYVNDGGYTTDGTTTVDTWIANNPISATEGDALKLGAQGWTFINGAAAITGIYYKIDDGELVGGAQFLQNREDAANAMAPIGGTVYNTMGFVIPRNTIDVSGCSVGKHEVKVYALAKDANENVTYCRIVKIPFEIKERTMPKINSISLSLEQTLTMNFKVKSAKFTSEPTVGYFHDPFIEVTFGGKTVTLDEYTVSGDFFVFSFHGIGPEQMTDTVSAVLKAYKGDTLNEKAAVEYSIESYCLNLLADEGSSDELKTLLVELLQYGALTQVYTEYNLDALADANIDDYLDFDLGQYEDISPVKMLMPMGNNVEVTYVSAGLRLEDSIALRIMINAEDIEDLAVSCDYNDQSVDRGDFVHVSGNRYYVYLPGIYAQDMRKEITVEIFRMGNRVANQFHYSVADYIGVMLEDTDDQDLFDLLEGLMQYGDAAAAYADSLTV